LEEVEADEGAVLVARREEELGVLHGQAVAVIEVVGWVVPPGCGRSRNSALAMIT
jgi:hypothetical protein